MPSTLITQTNTSADASIASAAGGSSGVCSIVVGSIVVGSITVGSIVVGSAGVGSIIGGVRTCSLPARCSRRLQAT